jgi:hypothetical protein
MGRMNWSRIILGGLVASLVMVVLAILNMEMFQQTWLNAALELLGPRTDADWWRFFAALAFLCVVGGVLSVWLYAAIRPRYGPGPKTAAFVGVAMFLLTSAVDLFWASTGFVPTQGMIVPLLAWLPILIVVAMAGAWIYKEDDGPASAR